MSDPIPLTEADHSTLEAAAAKRRKKLARYIDTPQALARRALLKEMEDKGLMPDRPGSTIFVEEHPWEPVEPWDPFDTP